MAQTNLEAELWQTAINLRGTAAPAGYDPPLTRFGRGAVDRRFSDEQIDEMIEFVNSLTIKT